MTRNAPPKASALREMSLVVLAAVALTLGFTLWLKSKVPVEHVGGLEVGKSAPTIRVAGWLNGAPPTDVARKVVVVNAWYTTCPNCHARAQEVAETYHKFHDRGVVFIGLTYEPVSMLGAIERSVAEMGMVWPNGYGALETLIEFEAEYFPAVWVIGPDGRIAWNGDSNESLDEGIENSLAAARAN